MDYVERVKKVNALARSLKDNGLAPSMDDAVKMAEGIIDKGSPKEQETVSSVVEDIPNSGAVKTEEPEARDPIPPVITTDEDVEEQKDPIPPVVSVEEPEDRDPTPPVPGAEEEPIPESGAVKTEEETHHEEVQQMLNDEEETEEPKVEEENESKGFFDKIKDKFTNKEEAPEEPKEKGFFEKIKERFVRKEEADEEEIKSDKAPEGFEEVKQV